VIFSVNIVIFGVRFIMSRGTIINKIDTGMCDDFVLACIGVSACCVVLYLFIYLFITIYQNLFFHEHNSYLSVSHLYDHHNIVTDPFLFPIRIANCLLLPLRQPRCMQLSVFPPVPALTLSHFAVSTAVTSYGKLIDK